MNKNKEETILGLLASEFSDKVRNAEKSSKGALGLIIPSFAMLISSPFVASPIIAATLFSSGVALSFSTIAMLRKAEKGHVFSTYRDVFNAAAQFYTTKTGLVCAALILATGMHIASNLQNAIDEKQNLGDLPEVSLNTPVPLNKAVSCEGRTGNVDVSAYVGYPARVVCPAPQ